MLEEAEDSDGEGLTLWDYGVPASGGTISCELKPRDLKKQIHKAIKEKAKVEEEIEKLQE